MKHCEVVATMRYPYPDKTKSIFNVNIWGFPDPTNESDLLTAAIDK